MHQPIKTIAKNPNMRKKKKKTPKTHCPQPPPPPTTITHHSKKPKKRKKWSCAEISPELIREVEARMNRNYLPPALKMHTGTNGTAAHSPPTVSLSGPSTMSALARRAINGRACKLPTVQEVGKLSSSEHHSHKIEKYTTNKQKKKQKTRSNILQLPDHKGCHTQPSNKS